MEKGRLCGRKREWEREGVEEKQRIDKGLRKMERRERAK